MKKLVCLTLALMLALTAMSVPALAEGTIKRIGVLKPLNMSEAEFVAIQKLRCEAGEMMNEEGVAVAEHPYYDGMIDENPEIIYFDTLNSMVMALEAGQVDAIDLNRSTAEYLCANNDGLAILMDYDVEEPTVLTDFVYNSLLNCDYALMLTKDNQALADELSDAVIAMEDDGTLAKLADTYISGAINGEIPDAETPVIEGAETIRVAVTGDLPPMDYVSADGEPVGFNEAVLAELSTRVGKNFELVDITADARPVALASGLVDVVFWSRGCMGVKDMLELDVPWQDLFELEDEEDIAMAEKVDQALASELDYEAYGKMDIPDELTITSNYFNDSIVLVAKE